MFYAENVYLLVKKGLLLIESLDESVLEGSVEGLVVASAPCCVDGCRRMAVVASFGDAPKP